MPLSMRSRWDSLEKDHASSDAQHTRMTFDFVTEPNMIIMPFVGDALEPNVPLGIIVSVIWIVRGKRGQPSRTTYRAFWRIPPVFDPTGK